MTSKNKKPLVKKAATKKKAPKLSEFNENLLKALTFNPKTIPKNELDKIPKKAVQRPPKGKSG